MTYVHLRRRIGIQTRTPNPMAALYYADIFTLHGVRFRLQFQQLTTGMGSDWNWGSQSVSASVIKPLQLQRSIYMHEYILVSGTGCNQRGIKILMPNLSWRVLSQKMTTWNTISPRCWLVAMWWHHFATFDDIILQHLMTSFWMTCTFWILNKQVKNSFLKLCTIFHRSSLDLDVV